MTLQMSRCALICMGLAYFVLWICAVVDVAQAVHMWFTIAILVWSSLICAWSFFKSYCQRETHIDVAWEYPIFVTWSVAICVGSTILLAERLHDEPRSLGTIDSSVILSILLIPLHMLYLVIAANRKMCCPQHELFSLDDRLQVLVA